MLEDTFHRPARSELDRNLYKFVHKFPTEVSSISGMKVNSRDTEVLNSE